MLRTKIQNFIENAQIDDLIKWLNDNPNMVIHSADSLMSRLSKEKFTPKIMSELIDALYTNKESVSEVEFNLLEEMVRSYIYNEDQYVAISDDDIEQYPNLFLVVLFISSYDMMHRLCHMSLATHAMSMKKLFQAIMDVYIPSSQPELVIYSMINFYPIEVMLRHCNDTKWFTKIYEEKSVPVAVSLHELLLLFKYTSDIYSNREMKVEFFMNYHRVIRTCYSYTEHFQSLENRYSKYFGDNTTCLIAEILQLLEKYIISEDDTELFMIEWSNQYSNVNKQVLHCLVRDVCCLSNFIPRYMTANATRNASNMINIISKMWGSDQFIPESIEDNSISDAINSIDIDILSDSVDFDYATEAVHKDSAKMHSGEKKIYKAYRTYKSAEEKVDSQITKAVTGIKGVMTGDVRTEIIEGKKFSAIGLLKKLLGTCALFSFGKIKAVIAIVVSYALKKKTTVSERRKIIMELETEIKLIDEKIEDARGDGNRDAKYSMMRTKAELENALKKIQYGLEADTRSLKGAKSVLNSIKEGRTANK